MCKVIVHNQTQAELGDAEIKRHTVADILRFMWDNYLGTHIVRDVERKEVEKALLCRSGLNGVFIYICASCGESAYQLLGCNSRICASCGKRYTDQWAKSLSKAMFKVIHRHFVLSVPSQIWPYLKENRALWKTYMDSAIETCNDYFPKIMKNHLIRPGCIVVLHPFGKDMKFQPHLHVIATEGGFLGNDFVPKKFFPARQFAKCWQYHVSKNLQQAGMPNSLFSELYKKYDGFYVWIHKNGTIYDPKDIAKYLGRYVRHPAIANSRILEFDEKTVKFYYNDVRDNGTTRHEVTMEINEFISALIQHIPDRQFKMIRYYGVYARRAKKTFYKSSLQSSIASTVQDTLYMTGWKFKPMCPHCGGFLCFIGFQKIPPPDDHYHWDIKNSDLVRWKNLSMKN